MAKTNKTPREEYKYEPHHFYLNKHCGKQVCAVCGLVLLRNKATDWCAEKGCMYREHTSYTGTMKKLTKQFDF